jgi:hypothetical protein
MVALVCVLFLDLASLSIVSLWVVAVLAVAWVVVFVVACSWWTPHPRRLPWLAVALFGLWVVVVIGGSIASG